MFTSCLLTTNCVVVKLVEPEFISTKNMKTSVKVKDSKRNHKGCYKVTAKNELGEDSASVR